MSGTGMLALYNREIPVEFIQELASFDLFDYMTAKGMLEIYMTFLLVYTRNWESRFIRYHGWPGMWHYIEGRFQLSILQLWEQQVYLTI